MKKNINIIGCLSIALMACVLIGQGSWLYKVNKIKTEEFRQNVSFILSHSSENNFQKEFLDICVKFDFKCCLESDMKTFIWGTTDEMKEIELLDPLQQLNRMSLLVTYDFLYKNQLLDLQELNSAYSKVLQEKGIFQSPVLLIQDRETRDILMTTDSLSSLEGKILTSPIDVGYECKHQLVVAFSQPSILSSLTWNLAWEGGFFLGFLFCFIWQLRTMRMTWRSAKVQTMGIAHLEHELKKPLATMISIVGGIFKQNDRELTGMLDKKLRLLKAQLLKMTNMTDTMLTALKSSRLEIKRTVVDMQEEMELIVEMFATLKPSAKVDFQIEEGAEKPLLDNIYFGYLVINLVDNGIIYSKDSPEVKVWFGKEGEYWVLRVTDNGIGIPTKDQERIYQQFYRVNDNEMLKKTGFGLGLAFVKKVAKAHDGDVNVDSKLGQGSCFTIRLK